MKDYKNTSGEDVSFTSREAEIEEQDEEVKKEWRWSSEEEKSEVCTREREWTFKKKNWGWEGFINETQKIGGRENSWMKIKEIF